MRRVRILTSVACGLTVAVCGAGVAQAATIRYVATAAHGGTDPSNNCATQSHPCLTVSHAVTEASTGDTIQIGPGHFLEAVSTGSKALTLIGAASGTPAAVDLTKDTFIDASATTKAGITAGTTSVASKNLTLQKLRIEGGVGASQAVEPAVSYAGATTTPTLTISHAVLLEGNPSSAGSTIAALSIGHKAAIVSLVDSAVVGLYDAIDDYAGTGSLTIASDTITSTFAGHVVPFPGPVGLGTDVKTVMADSLINGAWTDVYDDAPALTLLRTLLRPKTLGLELIDHGSAPVASIRDSVIAPASGTLGTGVQVDAPLAPPDTEVPTVNLFFDTILARNSGSAIALDVSQAATGTHVNTHNTILRSIDTSGGSGNDDIASGSQAINWDVQYTAYTQTSGVGVPQPNTGTNFDVAPHFVDDDGANLRLSSDSTLFDKGDPSIVLAGETDIAGAPRALAHVCGGAALPDIGAFEAPAPSCPPPTATLTTPSDGATYTQGQSVTAAFACGAPPAPATLSACTGTVADGGRIDTSTPGTYTFTVTATSSDGTTATKTATYTVKTLPKPTLGAIKVSHKTFRTGSKLASVAKAKHAKKPPVGTTFSFELNTSATLKLAFAKVTPGRKVKRKCVAQTKHNHHDHSCKRSKGAGSITLSGHAGTDKLRFQGRLSKHKKLKPGTYTLTITATNTSGKSRSRTATFTIVR
jgi:hypothetical protein